MALVDDSPNGQTLLQVATAIEPLLSIVASIKSEDGSGGRVRVFGLIPQA